MGKSDFRGISPIGAIHVGECLSDRPNRASIPAIVPSDPPASEAFLKYLISVCLQIQHQLPVFSNFQSRC